MRLLVISARYPTPDRPSAGTFVRDRLRDPSLRATVVAPTRYDLPGWRRYLSLVRRAMTARGPFDGVEGHFVLPSGVVALLAARLRRLPLVVYAHGGDVREMAQRNRLMRFAARAVVRGASAVVTNSQTTADLVSQLGARAAVVPPGIDLSRFEPQLLPAERRVLYLGGDFEHKGVDVARELADTLVGPGIREVDPDEIPGLMAAHTVVLVPSRAEPFGLVAAHSVVLVPSRAEPFGLVAVEAIASGRWVVARAVGGLVDIVTDGVNGTLVSDDDFAGALARVPAYDPATVASTARRFSVLEHRQGMAETWSRVLQGRGQSAKK